MKKLVLLFCILMVFFGLVACKTKEEPKDFNFKQGDEVILDGVIYTYYTYETLYETAIPFIEEASPKAYYNYYCFDMSSYKEQPAIVSFEGNLIDFESDYHLKFNADVFYNFLKYSNPIYSPKDTYFYRLRDYFSPEMIKEGFIVTGYTKDLKKAVVIPKTIMNQPVIEIGYKAFENAPLESFTYAERLFLGDTFYNIIHPFAFSHCENLKEIKTGARVLSMGISNCPNLESISYIAPTTDCSLFNLPALKSVLECDPIPIHSVDYKNFYQHVRLCSSNGIRKSSIYNCPNLETLTGRNLSQENNVVYYSNYFPYYIFNDYSIMLRDALFSDYAFDKYCYAVYNDQNEIYLPYLNNGLNYKGELYLDPESTQIKEEEDAFYVSIAYLKLVEGATFYPKEYEEPVLLKINKR